MNIDNILIIEDDVFQLKLMMKMLTKITTAQIHVASNGQQALLKLVDSAAPDLIICDLNMPEMDGMEFLRIISSQQIDSHIILTSSAAEDVLSSVKKMAKSYGLLNIYSLQKPIGQHQLQQLIESLLFEQLIINNEQLNNYQPQNIELIRALEERQFCAFYQPHVDAHSNHILGAEALMRWYHPSKGILTPNYFITRLTELGLLSELTYQVIESSIKACSRWHELGYQYYVSVNVSPLDLVDLNFAGRVLDLLKVHGLAEKYLNIEITETDICPNLAKALETVARLRIKGVGISIDDFGTGYSSLEQLINSPFTELKVDQLFVRKMVSNPKHLAAVTFSLKLAQSLGLRSVAEGVETEVEAQILREQGCDVLQGYLFSPAVEEDKFLDWARRHSANNEYCIKA